MPQYPSESIKDFINKYETIYFFEKEKNLAPRFSRATQKIADFLVTKEITRVKRQLSLENNIDEVALRTITKPVDRSPQRTKSLQPNSNQQRVVYNLTETAFPKLNKANDTNMSGFLMSDKIYLQKMQDKLMRTLECSNRLDDVA